MQDRFSIFRLFPALLLGLFTQFMPQVGYSFPTDNIFQLSANAVCPGSEIYSCRNPDCGFEPSKLQLGCEGKDTTKSNEACRNASVERAVARRLNIPSAVGLYKTEKSCKIETEKIQEGQIECQDTSPFECGFENGLCYCYFNRCLAQVTLRTTCESRKYCGYLDAECRTILNGLRNDASQYVDKSVAEQKLGFNLIGIVVAALEREDASSDQALEWRDAIFDASSNGDLTKLEKFERLLASTSEGQPFPDVPQEE